MTVTKFDTKEMLGSQMERQQHRGSLFRSAMKFGQTMAGNKDILVIDMSYWQDHTRIDYDKFCENVDGVILRGTYGVWKDTRVDIHHAEITKRKKPVGFYCYLIGNYTGKQQCDKFYEAIGDKEMKMGIWADIEDRRPGTAMSRRVADDFMVECDKKFKKLTDIYTGPYAWKEIMVTGGHSHRKLWLANYLVNTPRMPIGGDWKTWWLWQYTEKGKTPGYYGDLDHNRFNGTTSMYNDWVNPGQKPPLTQKQQHDLMWDYLKGNFGY